MTRLPARLHVELVQELVLLDEAPVAWAKVAHHALAVLVASLLRLVVALLEHVVHARLDSPDLPQPCEIVVSHQVPELPAQEIHHVAELIVLASELRELLLGVCGVHGLLDILEARVNRQDVEKQLDLLRVLAEVCDLRLECRLRVDGLRRLLLHLDDVCPACHVACCEFERRASTIHSVKV